jgi:hypothetical protein
MSRVEREIRVSGRQGRIDGTETRESLARFSAFKTQIETYKNLA